ncbi:MAG: cbb3-type cytochrome c oxidase subunit II [Nitrospirota bacterium]|jgi:cbb3-type cytochrome c oxidase subunit II
MERFSTVFLVAGVVFFAFSVWVMAWLPVAHLRDIPHTKLEVVSEEVRPEFAQLAEMFPESFKKYYPAGVTPASYQKALRLGRDTYIAEACWHCHSQFVRPVSNEVIRFGPVSQAGEYQNDLQFPHLFGTRRVGPDLIREHGVHTNDWHVAHFWNPQDVVPTSVMPRYPWFFDNPDDPDTATLNERGIAMIAYVQWLGSWVTSYPATLYNLDAADGGA